MKVLYLNTKDEAEKAWRELYSTGFCGCDLTIQYNGNVKKYMLIVNNIENSYRSDFVFEGRKED